MSLLSRHFARSLSLVAPPPPLAFPLSGPLLTSSPSSLFHPVRHRHVIIQKRAKEGLFAGKHMRFGNSVSHSHHKSHHPPPTPPLLHFPFPVDPPTDGMLCCGVVMWRRTRRSWSPNVQVKWYYSELLNERFRLHVTTHAMRCIDKAGGFDHYLLFSPKHKLGHRTLPYPLPYPSL